ncbi:hypothetical protein SAMN04488072_102157 [Lentibacillus halodurans]|uniref:Uncharacterized protein n=1 Tax=Lentibacillus halodurans TaxID=237679 RepID=A0A1I0W4L3_9BACI|nr:hypothetical protein [Lentibacillus halodurans]SFA82816.1 hypothetical protein SAMN04488072_102157 [Lentibacillus halodurans]
MGYLLPINHYQYYDYQRRIIKERPDPFHIERPYKTILRAAYHDHHRSQVSINSKERPDLKLRGPKLPEAEKIYAEMTGKGRYFSNSV